MRIGINKTLKLTPQRLAVMDYLKGNKEHPSAENIYRAIKAKYPTISLATIYNTLEALKNHGIVQELQIDPRKKRYDSDTTSHNHLMCIECGRVEDIYEERALENVETIKRYKILKSSVSYYGICPECLKKQ